MSEQRNKGRRCCCSSLRAHQLSKESGHCAGSYFGEQTSSKQEVETLTASGALLVADSTVYDPGDMHKIALKVLAHEVRVLRQRAEKAQQLAVRQANEIRQLQKAGGHLIRRMMK